MLSTLNVYCRRGNRTLQVTPFFLMVCTVLVTKTVVARRALLGSLLGEPALSTFPPTGHSADS